MHRLPLLVASWVVAFAAHPAHRSQWAPELLGRWAGESACVGARPACRAEHVVYQIDSAGVGALRVRGMRVVGRDTVDMGDLACRVSAGGTSATCRVALGVWRFWLTRDQLEGSLTLADSTRARHVEAHRLTNR
jgi:hypothetical protein